MRLSFDSLKLLGHMKATLYRMGKRVINSLRKRHYFTTLLARKLLRVLCEKVSDPVELLVLCGMIPIVEDFPRLACPPARTGQGPLPPTKIQGRRIGRTLNPLDRRFILQDALSTAEEILETLRIAESLNSEGLPQRSSLSVQHVN